MAELRTCVCGKQFWFPGERWKHRDCATNAAATNGIATNADATNAPDANHIFPSGKTKNRRARAAYNRYQRDYMRARRARVAS